MPDYANAISFNSLSYTAPSDGYIDIRVDLSSNGQKTTLTFGISIERNGVTYPYVAHNGIYSDVNAYMHYYGQLFHPVKSGDIITITTSAPSHSFTQRRFLPLSLG